MRKLKTLAATLSALLCVGCVSAGKYNALQTLNNDLQSQLALTKTSANKFEGDLGEAKKSNESLTQEKDSLTQQKEELLKVKSDLETQKAELVTVTAQLSAQRDELQAEKDALLKESQAKQAQYDGLVGQLQQQVNDGNLKITQYKNMLTVDVADKILFDSGHADLKKDGKAVLLKVGEALQKSDKYIRVVGHTDNVPLSANAAYASNWDLSAARATVVVKFLQEQSKLDPTRLMAAGRGEYAPVAPNDTPANKQKNRRIEITLLDRNLVEAVEAAASSTATANAAAVTPTPEAAK
jgi:chemotaxis protein MotB